MMTVVSMLAVVAAFAPVAAQRATEPGAETTIPYSAGGIRTVQAEGDGSVVLVQDQTLRWYRVTLTGPCFADRGGALIVRQADPVNRLDRFARVSNSRFPDRVCGITSIVRAAVPPKATRVR